MQNFRTCCILAAAFSAVMIEAPRCCQAQGMSQSVNAHQFSAILDGPVRSDFCDLFGQLQPCLEVDHGITGEARIGKATFALQCISLFPFPGVPPCEGQMDYRDFARFDLPGGTILGELDGWSSESTKSPEHGGDFVTSVIEEGRISQGTGKYAGAKGEFHSRIVTEIAGGGPFFIDKGLVLFEIRRQGRPGGR